MLGVTLKAFRIGRELIERTKAVRETDNSYRPPPLDYCTRYCTSHKARLEFEIRDTFLKMLAGIDVANPHSHSLSLSHSHPLTLSPSHPHPHQHWAGGCPLPAALNSR